MHGGGEEEGGGANLTSTVLLLDAPPQSGNPGAVWYKPECPLLLFPLPLPWRAHCPLLLHYSLLLLTFAKRPGEVPSAHTGQKGQAPGRGLQPITSSLFTLTSYFREAGGGAK